MHPSASKLFALLHRAYPTTIRGNNLEILNGISKSCPVCRTYIPGLISFSVRFKDKQVFNKRTSMDYMYLNSAPVFQIIDTDTNFSAFRFVLNASTATIWETRAGICVKMYSGYPSHVHIEQSPRSTALT